MESGGFKECNTTAAPRLKKGFYSLTEKSISEGIISIKLSDTYNKILRLSVLKTSTFRGSYINN